MEEVACNLCGARGFTVVFGAGVAQRNQVVRCNRCRFMYATLRLETHHDHWPDVADFDYQTLGLQPLRRVADWVSRRSSLRDWTMNIDLRDIQRVCLRPVEPAPAQVSHPQRTEQPTV